AEMRLVGARRAGGEASAVVLEELVCEGPPPLRPAAARALGEIRARGSVELLCSLVAEAGEELACGIAEALGRLGVGAQQARAEDALLALLARGSALEREAAARALGQVGTMRSVSALRSASTPVLFAPDWQVRSANEAIQRIKARAGPGG